MAIGVELRDIATGKPVRPDFTPRIPRDKLAKTIKRTLVQSARELAQLNREFSQGTPIELGSKAVKIQRQFRAGKIDILT